MLPSYHLIATMNFTIIAIIVVYLVVSFAQEKLDRLTDSNFFISCVSKSCSKIRILLYSAYYTCYPKCLEIEKKSSFSSSSSSMYIFFYLVLTTMHRHFCSQFFSSPLSFVSLITYVRLILLPCNPWS